MKAFHFALDDLNGDGKPDMASVNASAGDVQIGLGQGDGTFAPSQDIGDIALQTVRVAIGDFTGDGRPDVVANGGAMVIALLRGRGDGTFMGPSRWVTGDAGLAAADLDAKPGADLLSISPEPGTIYGALGTKSGLRAPKLVELGVSGGLRALGDLNNDGRPDVLSTAVVIKQGEIKSLLEASLNVGKGRFASRIRSLVRVETAGSGIGVVALNDVTGDGKLDAIGGFDNLFPSPDNLFLLRGRGDGRFSKPVLFDNGDTNADVDSIAVADVTGDGKLDIVSHTLSAESVLAGDGQGGFGPPIVSGSSGPAQTGTLIGDVTGDGRPDIVAVLRVGGEDFGASQVLLQKGDGSGHFTLIQTLNFDANTGASTIADLNGDSRPDVASAGSRGSNGGRSGLFVMLAKGDGTLSAPVDYPRGSGALVAADCNRDGTPDLATNGSARILLNLNLGDGTFATASEVPGAGPPVLAGDVDGNGAPDLLSATGSGFAVYLNRTP